MKLEATGSATITWELQSDSQLPEGLALDSDGTIHGTPTAAVTEHGFTVVAANTAGSDTKTYMISVGESHPATFFRHSAATSISVKKGVKYEIEPLTDDASWLQYVSFSSSKTTVAVVVIENGKAVVSTKATGTATINVYYKNGDVSFSYKFTVKVV
jgi:hypothetical protein